MICNKEKCEGGKGASLSNKKEEEEAEASTIITLNL